MAAKSSRHFYLFVKPSKHFLARLLEPHVDTLAVALLVLLATQGNVKKTPKFVLVHNIFGHNLRLRIEINPHPKAIGGLVLKIKPNLLGLAKFEIANGTP